MIAALFAFLPTLLKGLWSFATSRIGAPIVVAAGVYLYAHHAGVVQERARIESEITVAVAKERLRQQFAAQEIQRNADDRYTESSVRERALNEKVEAYAEELRKRPPAAACPATDADVRWLRQLSPSYRAPGSPERKR